MNHTPCPVSGRFNPAAPPVIEAENLCKTFKGSQHAALDSVTLKIPRGVIFGMLGPNGAGKTTLLSILCGLLKPSAGWVKVDGKDIFTQASSVKRLLGVVPQEPAIYPTLTARENLEYFGRMQGITGEHLQTRVRECLRLGELNEVENQRVEHFSGGFKRRLNLVIGLIHEPQILILDEPTVAIDPHSRSFIHQRLRELHARGVSIIISTHYMDEAEQLCHHIAIINQGKIVTQGPLDALLESQRGGSIQAQLGQTPPPSFQGVLQRIPGVLEAYLDGRCFLVTTDNPGQTVVPVLDAVKLTGIPLVSLNFGTASLEQVFLSLTESPPEQ
jgi:ABC-2 type transport system ATP-binding protein